MEKTSMLAPRARTTGLVVRDLNGETLIYDVEQDRAHALNPFASRVWKCCDGETSITAIADSLRGEGDEPVSIDAVWHAVSRLGQDGLLDEEVAPPVARMSRRGMMQKVGLAASVAVITSIAVPATAAFALCPNNACGAKCTGSTCSGTGNQCLSCTRTTGSSASCPHTCCAARNATVTSCTGIVCCNAGDACNTNNGPLSCNNQQ